MGSHAYVHTPMTFGASMPNTIGILISFIYPLAQRNRYPANSIDLSPLGARSELPLCVAIVKE